MFDALSFDEMTASLMRNGGIMILPAINADGTTGFLVMMQKPRRAQLQRIDMKRAARIKVAGDYEALGDDMPDQLRPLKPLDCYGTGLFVAKNFDELQKILADNRIDPENEPELKGKKK
jgi:hypothetical protein